MNDVTPTPPPLPRHIRERINRLVHGAALRHEIALKADLTRRLIDARASAGFASLAPALAQIEAEFTHG